MVLLTGKSLDPDQIPVDCSVQSDKPVLVLHGTGKDLTDEVTVDIRRAWVRM